MKSAYSIIIRYYEKGSNAEIDKILKQIEDYMNRILPKKDFKSELNYLLTKYNKTESTSLESHVLAERINNYIDELKTIAVTVTREYGTVACPHCNFNFKFNYNIFLEEHLKNHTNTVKCSNCLKSIRISPV